MSRLISRALWFTGICLMFIGFRNEDGSVFILGALLALVGSTELRNVSQPE